MKKALQITPFANGYAISVIDLPDYCALSDTIAITREIGAQYECPAVSRQTVLSIIREYLANQEKENTPPETP